MKIHTFTVVVGSKACNMACPYCVSKMTPAEEIKVTPINWRNFDIACRFAQISGVTTVLFTGKGEPTLDPDGIKQYLQRLGGNSAFPFIELQTNGIRLDPECKNILGVAKEWYDLGMTLICISVAHHDAQENNKLLRPVDMNFNFWRAVYVLHKIGFTVRINCTLVRGGIDSPLLLAELVESCHRAGVEQITVRMVTKPSASENVEVSQWVCQHQFKDEWVDRTIVENGGVLLLNLPHGAKVYDWNGQNICTSTCLTETTDRDDIRQLIFFPTGRLSYSWSHLGAIIL